MSSRLYDCICIVYGMSRKLRSIFHNTISIFQVPTFSTNCTLWHSSGSTMATNDALMSAMKQLQDQVQSLQQQMQSIQYQQQQPSYPQYVCQLLSYDLRPCTEMLSQISKAQHSNAYAIDPELTSIPRWYQQSPLLQPYRTQNPYHPVAPNHPTTAYQHQNQTQSDTIQQIQETTVSDSNTRNIHRKKETIHSYAKQRKDKRKQKSKKKSKRGQKNKLDMNDQDTLEQLGVSKDLMNFFYNGEIRRNRLRIEKAERERAEIEAIPTVRQQEINEGQRRNRLYGKANHKKLKQREIAMDAAFMKAMDDMRQELGPNEEIVHWPATPLSY